MLIMAADRIGKSRVRVALVALALVFLSIFALCGPALADTDGMVRVRLTRLGAPEAVTLTADCDYCLADDASVRVGAGEAMRVSASAGELTLSWGDKKAALGDSARLIRTNSGSHGAQFVQPELSNRFCGDLMFSASGGVVSATLMIDVENYLYGVVGYEMAPSSNLEALKAQAVAARTYALRKKASRTDAAYDLTDTTADQVFKGYSGDEAYKNSYRAVDETRGAVLFYGDALAQCYYCASNGGQTECSKNAWGTALDYTCVKDDPYDFESAATVKSASINKDLSDMNEALRTALAKGLRQQLAAKGLNVDASNVHVNAIESVTACDSLYPAPSRVYESLTFKLNVTVRAAGTSRSGSVAVSIPTFGGFEDWYDLSINGESNETVWVSETDRAFVVSFRRVGHGVGMSQRGAQVMAANYGKSAAEILSFYYPGTVGKILNLDGSAQEAKSPAPRPDQPVIATARVNGKTALLSSPSEDAAAEAALAAGARVDVYAVKGGWAAVGSSGKYGFIPTDALQSFSLVGSTVVKADGVAFGVARQPVQVFQLPVTTAKPVSSVETGETVRVFAWTEEWAMLEAPDGAVGFVPLNALDLVTPDGESEAEDAEAQEAAESPVTRVRGKMYRNVTAETAWVYQNSSADSGVVEALGAGDRVQVGAYNADWAYVRLSDGRKGFVRLGDLS